MSKYDLLSKISRSISLDKADAPEPTKIDFKEAGEVMLRMNGVVPPVNTNAPIAPTKADAPAEELPTE